MRIRRCYDGVARDRDVSLLEPEPDLRRFTSTYLDGLLVALAARRVHHLDDVRSDAELVISQRRTEPGLPVDADVAPRKTRDLEHPLLPLAAPLPLDGRR